MKNCGFSLQLIKFIPVSGFTGDNLVKLSSNCSWYRGPTLIETLDSFTDIARDISEPFALSIQDAFKGGIGPSGAGDVTVCGRISTGSVQIGDSVLALPIKEVGNVKAISIGDSLSDWAVSGDRVSITISGLDVSQFHLGSVICDPNNPIPISDSFLAQIQTFDISVPITIGVPIVFHHLGTAESGSIVEYISVYVGLRVPRLIPA